MKKRIAKFLYALLIVATSIMTPIVSAQQTYAEDLIQIEKGAIDDLLAKLAEAARINAIFNTTKLCIQNWGQYEEWGVDIDEAWKGNLFLHHKGGILELEAHRGAPLWLENKVRNVSKDKLIGAIYCGEGDGTSNNKYMFQLMVEAIDKKKEGDALYPKMYCHKNSPIGQYIWYGDEWGVDEPRSTVNSPAVKLQDEAMRLTGRWEGGAMGSKPYPMNYHCMDKQRYADLDFVKPNAGSGVHLSPSDPRGPGWDEYNDYVAKMDNKWATEFKGIYEEYTPQLDNQYLPDWGTIGTFDNIDGYFNYIYDYNTRCEAKIHDTQDMKQWQPVTTYERDKTKIVATTKFYETENGKNYSWDYSLSQNNPVKNCMGLLERIEELRYKTNGVVSKAGLGREYGYEGMILELLKQTCSNMKRVDSETGEVTEELLYPYLKAKYESIINNPDANAVDVQRAKDGLALIEKWEGNGYVEVDDSEPNKIIYRCIETADMEVTVIEHESPSDDLVPEEDEDKEANCYTKAGPLGWILCPIIESLKDFIVRKYGEWVEPALVIDSDLFLTGNGANNGTYQAWRVFRDIANMAFIIMFVAVIISQVTGVGISNYGIKKALPKLIAIAIMINLSFVICQVSIDVANITGNGIKGVFNNITTKIGHPTSIKVDSTTIHAKDTGGWQDTTTWGESFMQNGLTNTAIIIIVCALGAAIILSQGLAIIIPVLLLLIGVAITILGLIIILGVRQAAAVMLVVFAPLAIVCYAFPNTKSVFDKWFKSFEALLLAYPICSALVYGGDMAGTILLNAASGNKWVLIAAAVVSIAPIFIIPRVIRQSMGAIAGAITHASTRAKGSAQRKAGGALERSRLTDRRNFNRMMRAQGRAASSSSYGAKRGRRTISRIKDPGKLRAGQRRKYNIAMGAVNSDNADIQNAYESQFRGQEDSAIIETLQNSNVDANMLVASINSLKHENNVTDLMKNFSGTDAYKQMMQNDPTARQRVADALTARRGSVVNQSMGKLMAKGQDYDEMISSGSLREKVQGAGAGVMANQNKDVFSMEGAGDLFSDDQIRAGLTAGYAGDTAAAFHGMVQGIVNGENGEKRTESIVSGMTAEDVASLNTATANGKEVGSLSAIGGPAIIMKHNKAAITTLNSEDGVQLRAKMNVSVGKALNIKGFTKTDSGSSHDGDDSGHGPSDGHDSNPDEVVINLH